MISGIDANLLSPELKAAIKEVVYEYANLVSAGELLKVNHPPPVNTHIQDAFLLSCRKLGDFLTRQPRLSDIAVWSYGVSFRTQTDLPAWYSWKPAVDVQLAHISTARSNPKHWDGSANVPLLSEFRTAWGGFLKLLHPTVRNLFDIEIQNRQAGAGFQHLNLK